MNPDVGIIVLAAGESSRMGAAKQLLRYEGETLVRRATEAASTSLCRPVVVVLGARHDSLIAELGEAEAQIVVNEAWAEGMGSSIRCGIAALEASTAGRIEAAVITLCDQPFVTGEVINRVVRAFRPQSSPLVVSEYEVRGEMTRGVPALFGRALFPELMTLRGSSGAKSIIKRYASQATIVRASEAAFDVDTPHDYQTLLRVQG